MQFRKVFLHFLLWIAVILSIKLDTFKLFATNLHNATSSSKTRKLLVGQNLNCIFYSMSTKGRNINFQDAKLLTQKFAKCAKSLETNRS